MTEPHQLAHAGDPDTSVAAAAIAALSPSSRKVKLAIVDLLRDFGPQSADDLQRLYARLRADKGWPDVQLHSVKRRLSDLVNAAVVRDTGRREQTPWGRDAAVWELVTDVGLERLMRQAEAQAAAEDAAPWPDTTPEPTAEEYAAAVQLPEIADVIEAVAWKVGRASLIGSGRAFAEDIREWFGSLQAMQASVAEWKEATRG